MQHVDVKVHESIATVLMDRPQRRNALSPSLIEDLTVAFSDIHQEKRVKAVVLSGSGCDFCSGLDLHTMREISELEPEQSGGEWFTTWQALTRLLEQMLRFPKPIIAAVDGAALGAGLSLALAADLMVVSETARLGSVAVRRGLVGSTTAALLAFRAGASLAARMSLTGQAIDAAEAYRVGLCDKPVPSSQVWVAAADRANRCSQAPREAVQATKKVLNEDIGEALITQLFSGAAISASVCATESAGEGIQAFCDKREPQWPN
jgi:enoyl-CoA hydratase/carnithine racemase